FLTSKAFTRAAPPFGVFEYRRPSHEPGSLAVIQGVVKHQGSGWDYTIDDLRRYFERVAARVGRTEWKDGQEGREGPDPASPALPAQLDPPPFFAALERWYLASAAILGRRT